MISGGQNSLLVQEGAGDDSSPLRGLRETTQSLKTKFVQLNQGAQLRCSRATPVNFFTPYRLGDVGVEVGLRMLNGK